MVSTKLKNKLTVYLARKAQQAKGEADLKALKAELDTELDQVLTGGAFQNGRLDTGVARVAVMLNPPKLVWDRTGESLSVVEREAVAVILPERYTLHDVRIADVLNAVQRGQDGVAGILADKAIAVEQGSRFDIKKP